MVYYTVCIYILSIYYILYNGMILTSPAVAIFSKEQFHPFKNWGKLHGHQLGKAGDGSKFKAANTDCIYIYICFRINHSKLLGYPIWTLYRLYRIIAAYNCKKLLRICEDQVESSNREVQFQVASFAASLIHQLTQ